MFENTDCERCGHRRGYLPNRQILSAVRPDRGNWIVLAAPDDRYRFCANSEQHGCNGMVPASAADSLCAACCHNRTIPDISNPTNHVRWQKIEMSTRRLVQRDRRRAGHGDYDVHLANTKIMDKFPVSGLLEDHWLGRDLRHDSGGCRDVHYRIDLVTDVIGNRLG